MSKLTEINVVFDSERWRPRESDNHFVVAGGTMIEAGKPDEAVTLVGEIERGELCCGVTYRFFGTWENDRRGRQFRFKTAIPGAPHNRHGLVKYLAKYCPGIGPGIAGRIFDALKSESCPRLRNDPVGAAQAVNEFCRRNVLSEDVAVKAGEALRAVVALEDTRIELTSLLHGRGFSGSLIETLAKLWGPSAAMRIRRDPFILLARKFPGCGFLRVDRLYKELGLPVNKMRRQMFCLVHAMRENNDGHTWHSANLLAGKLRAMIDGLTPRLERALRFGVKTGWLAVKRDDAGQLWVADAGAAENEQVIAERLLRLQAWLVEVPEGDAEQVNEGREEEESETHNPMTVLEELVHMGKVSGICSFCGKELTNEISRAHGYGPTCAENNGLPWDESVLNSELTGSAVLT